MDIISQKDKNLKLLQTEINAFELEIEHIKNLNSNLE